MGEVVTLSAPTRLDLPVDRVIDAAKEAGLQTVVILGYDRDGDEYFASSYADGGNVLWLMRRCEKKLLEMPEKLS